jgi:acyl-CoA thioester hydrolase
MDRYARTFHLRWADMDANGHTRHTVYQDLGSELRVAWLAEAGFRWADMKSGGVGPVLLREEIDYRRETGLGDALEVDLEVLGMSDDCARWKIRHTFRRPDGEISARLVVSGGWLDLDARRLTLPPEVLAKAFREAPRAADLPFEELKSLRR